MVCPNCLRTDMVKGVGSVGGRKRYKCFRCKGSNGKKGMTFYDIDQYKSVTKRKARWFL